MPTLSVGGQNVQVDDSFLKLPPDQQNATVEEIAGSLGLKGEATPQQQGGPQQPYSQPEGYFDAAVQGIPVVGPLLQKGGAAAAAAIQPLLGQNEGTTFGQRYDANLAELQKRTQKFSSDNPIGSTVAGLAGGVAATAPLMGVPAVADTLGFGAGPLLGNVAKGAGAGAAIGGADAAARGNDIAEGALWGAGFGGAAPAVGRAVGTAANAIGNRLAKPLTPTKQVALNNVGEALKNSGLTSPEAVTQRLNSVGPEAMLLDASPQLATKAGTIAASPGEGQQIIRNAIESRAAGAPDRIIGQVDQIMGRPVDLSQLGDTIYQNAKEKAAPLYAQAYSVPVESTPELQQALSTPVGKAALAKARNLALNNPDAPQSAMFNAKPQLDTSQLPDWAQGVLAKGGQGADQLRAALQLSGEHPSVDVRGLHLVRQALDDMISRAKSPVTSAGRNSLAAIQKNRAVVDSVLKQVEPMAQADSIFSDSSSIREAMKDGLNVFKNSQTPEDLAATLNGMSQAERAAFIQAGRVAVRNAMGTARNDAAAARSLFSKDFNQEKLRLLLGPEGASSILNRIGAEDSYAKLAPRLIGNSETAARALEKADLAEAHGLPSYHDVAVFSGTHGIVRRAVAGFIKSTLEAASAGRQKDIEANIAKMLTASGPDRAQVIDELMTAALKKDPSGKTNRLIAQAVARLPQSAAPDDHTNKRTQISLPSN